MSMFYHLPPTGAAIELDGSHATDAPAQLAHATFYDSGTSALAACMAACMAASMAEPAAGSMAGSMATVADRTSSRPEVILPAYACPDLVSAAVYAGLKPVLVDIAPSRPWLDLEQLEQNLTANTVAIVAVNFLGVGERWAQLRQIADANDVLLIEDSAQYFPAGLTGSDPLMACNGDLVVYSFGRGKPVSLLGGGAVVAKRSGLQALLPHPDKQADGLVRSLEWSLKTRLYNLMVSPRLYWLPESLPFLSLGETHYHELKAIRSMDPIRSGILSANIRLYQDDAGAVQRRARISAMVSSMISTVLSDAGQSMERLCDLPIACETATDTRLLRYPLLLDAQVRDQAHAQLQAAGLGCSVMYPHSLPRLPGLASILDTAGRYPAAEHFAAEILTLPVHRNVTDNDIQRMGDVLSRVLNQRKSSVKQ